MSLGYETHIYDGGKEALFLLLISFLVAFVFARLYTRQARIHGWGSASIGGIHLHHAVPGLVVALVAGLLAFTPWGTGARPVRYSRSPSAPVRRSCSMSGR